MTKPDPRLQALADIQEPQLVSDWYLAPIWWLLALLLFVALFWFLWRWRRQQQTNRPRDLALQELATIDLQQANAVCGITALLKRYLQTKVAQHPALTYSGLRWQQFLQHSLPRTASITLPDLLALQYQASPLADDIRAYADFAKYWLSHHQPNFIDTPGANDA